MDTEEPTAAAVEPAGDQPFKTLADNAPDIIARYDQDLRYLYVNPGIEVLSGIPPREFIGKTVAEVTIAPAGDSPVPAGQDGESGAAERKIRVLLVDDHSVVRQALAHLLNEAADIEVVGEAPDGQTAIDLARELVPDVVTMDISMPGMNGIEATRRIHAEFPAVRVIGLSMFSEDERAEEMHRAGAAAYLTKSGPADALLAAIRGRGNKTASEHLKHGRSTCAVTQPGDVRSGRKAGKGPRPASDDRARVK
jgi:CheY-like chemotaxis protein